MAKKVTVSRELVQEAMRHQVVTKQLKAIGDNVKTRADQIASNEGVEMETWVEESVRPGGRPQVVVYGDNVEQEWGSDRTERRRIIGRAGEEAS